MEFDNLTFWRKKESAASSKLSRDERLKLLRQFRSRIPQLPSDPGLVEPVTGQPKSFSDKFQLMFHPGDVLAKLIYQANPRYLSLGGAGFVVLLVAGIVGWQHTRPDKSELVSSPQEIANSEPYIASVHCSPSQLARSYPEIVIVNARLAAPGDQGIYYTLVLDHNRQQSYRTRSLVHSPGRMEVFIHQTELSTGGKAQIGMGGKEMFNAKGQYQGKITSVAPIPNC